MMVFKTTIIIGAFVQCHGVERNENDNVTIADVVQIYITNQDQVDVFNILANETTAKLYKMALSIGILDDSHLNDDFKNNSNGWLVDDKTSEPIRYDEHLKIQNIVADTQEMHLKVIKPSDLRVQVHITNGARTMTLWEKPKTSTRVIYQHAVSAGIIDSIFQFALCHEHDLHRKLSAVGNAESLEQHLDPQSPSELRLKVVDIPKETLMEWAFRGMNRKQEISFWEQAIMDHEHYGENSQIMAKVEGWTGKLDLKFLPPMIKSLVLKGRSLAVDLKRLRFTALKEVILDFEAIEDIDWLSLKRSQVEIVVIRMFGNTIKMGRDPKSGDYLYYL